MVTKRNSALTKIYGAMALISVLGCYVLYNAPFTSNSENVFGVFGEALLASYWRAIGMVVFGIIALIMLILCIREGRK